MSATGFISIGDNFWKDLNKEKGRHNDRDVTSSFFSLQEALGEESFQNLLLFC